MLKRTSQGYFYIDQMIDGQRVRRQLGSDPELARIKADRLLGVPAPTAYSNTDLSAFVSQYIQSRPIRDSYKKTLLYDFERFAGWCLDQRVDMVALDSQAAQQYMSQAYKDCSARTYNKVLNELQSWYGMLMRRGVVKTNPFSHIETKPVKEKEFPVLDSEQQHMLRSHPYIYRDFFIFLLETGMRENDAWNLRRVDINPKKKLARYTVTKSSTHKIKYCPLSGPAFDICAARFTDYIFPELHGSARNQRMCLWTMKVLVCDQDAVLHWTRHTFANNMLNKGVPLEALRDILGHNSITMTERYARSLRAESLHQYL